MSRSTVLFLLAATIGHIAEVNSGSVPGPNPGPGALGTDCYSCVSCPRVSDTTYVKTCPFSPNPVKVKKCVKYAEKHPVPVNNKNVSWVIRGCVSDRGSCEDLKLAYINNPSVSLEFCTECEGDKCNGGSRSLSDIFFAIFAVIIVPVLGKYILS